MPDLVDLKDFKLRVNYVKMDVWKKMVTERFSTHLSDNKYLNLKRKGKLDKFFFLL